MALFYNNTNVATSQNVYINNKASDAVYYNNNLVWKKDASVYPGYTWNVRGSKTNEVGTAPPSIIERPVSGLVANDAAVYAVVNLTPYNKIYFDYSVYYVEPYSTGMVGIGNFDTYGINGGWPNVTGIGWDNSINTYHTDPNGQGWGNGSVSKRFTLTLDVSGFQNSWAVGIFGRASSTVQATIHLVLNKCWCTK